MSSIAYATDQKMIEYHRLCGSRNINFWRLSARTGFSDFHKGDLLFFYARGLRGKKKGLVGYAHFDSMHMLNLKQMWNRYGTLNGYDNLQDMQRTIEKASRDHKVPEKMTGLYLTDVVFFLEPVYPKDIGITINDKLESFTYLDQDDPSVTVRILQEAEKIGIDVWSSSQSRERETIFRKDELRQQMAFIHSEILDPSLTRSEESKARSLAKRCLEEQKDFELIRGSHTDLIRIDEKKMIVALPFVSQAKDHSERLLEFLGRVTYYRLRISAEKLRIPKTEFRILEEEAHPELESFLEELNHEE